MQVDTEEILEVSRHFGNLDDPRSHINRKHLLGDLIVICICGVLSGCDGPIAIGEWAKSKSIWLKDNLPLPNGIPSHDTIGRLLMALRPASFQACFTSWIEAIMKARESELRKRRRIHRWSPSGTWPSTGRPSAVLMTIARGWVLCT